MLRNEWFVVRTGAALSHGAEVQKAYREGRLKAWEDKKEEVMKKVREQGLSVHEDIAEEMYKVAAMSASRNHGGATIVVDRTLQADLNRCMQKIGEHRDMMKEYAAWIPMLQANPEKNFELNHDDWVYFFGKL